MNSIEFNGKTYNLDGRGYILNPEDWDEGFAEAISIQLGIKQLSEEHWQVINYIRERYLKYKSCPVIYEACKHNNLRLSKLKALFPAGYQRGACKLAGVSYVDGYLSYHYMDKVMDTKKPYSPDSRYTIDAHGFLADPSEWDESFAVNKADEMKMPNLLTEKHWEVIYYLRDKFEKTNTIPTIFSTCADNNLKIEEFEQLFPDGYHRGAVKLAGLKLL